MTTVCYRLPYADTCTLLYQTSGNPLAVRDIRELSGESGFVIAPFRATPAHPILCVRPDGVSACPVAALPAGGEAGGIEAEEYDLPGYRRAFGEVHGALSRGEVEKVVLARQSLLRLTAVPDGLALFARACRRYPRLFVALVDDPVAGCWLVATPEILVEGCSGRWHTIALAGTMPLTGSLALFDTPPGSASVGEAEPQWSDKNIREQRYVASYIHELLSAHASCISESGPRTVRAGGVAHLRSDFHFSLSGGDVTPLLHALHPTPAVCGLPAIAARDLIARAEPQPRAYYSGYMGWLGGVDDTHLYVTLRCARLRGREATLYAGGGILSESRAGDEWRETDYKMQTMREIMGCPADAHTDQSSHLI